MGVQSHMTALLESTRVYSLTLEGKMRCAPQFATRKDLVQYGNIDIETLTNVPGRRHRPASRPR
jgi:hypothetical protein